jgi:hypothetical protein
MRGAADYSIRDADCKSTISTIKNFIAGDRAALLNEGSNEQRETDLERESML